MIFWPESVVRWRSELSRCRRRGRHLEISLGWKWNLRFLFKCVAWLSVVWEAKFLTSQKYYRVFPLFVAHARCSACSVRVECVQTKCGRMVLFCVYVSRTHRAFFSFLGKCEGLEQMYSSCHFTRGILSVRHTTGRIAIECKELIKEASRMSIKFGYFLSQLSYSSVFVHTFRLHRSGRKHPSKAQSVFSAADEAKQYLIWSDSCARTICISFVTGFATGSKRPLARPLVLVRFPSDSEKCPSKIESLPHHASRSSDRESTQLYS